MNCNSDANSLAGKEVGPGWSRSEYIALCASPTARNSVLSSSSSFF